MSRPNIALDEYRKALRPIMLAVTKLAAEYDGDDPAVRDVIAAYESFVAITEARDDNRPIRIES